MSDNSKAKEVSQVEKLKLSDYANETVSRITAGYHLELYKLEGGYEAVGKIEQIARSWHDDQQVEKFRDTFENLSSAAKTKDKSDHNNNAAETDRDTELEKTQKELEHQIGELQKKLQESKSFKDSLRAGGIAGQLVGAELLKRINHDPSLLSDPIILVGSDFILEYLKAEHEHQESLKSHPDYQTYLPFIEGTKVAMDEVNEFREKVKQNQLKPTSSVV